MKLAVLALVVAMMLAAAIGTSSMLGYDHTFIGTLMSAVSPRPTPSPEPAAQEETAIRPQGEIAVPSGTFRGPTGNPTVKGPSGPPPQE